MNTEVSCFMPPPRPFEEVLESNAWEKFHQDILNKGNALDFLINFMTNIVNNKKIEFTYYVLDRDKYNEYIKECHLHTHYFNLLCQQEDKSDRNIWNIQNNLLRVLKRMKTEEPLHLLPQEDRLLTNKFIRMLNQPPRRDDYHFI